jgi:predicted DNA-binding protein
MQVLKTTFTLPDYIVSELADLAEELGEKKSHLVAEALSQYFDTMDLQVALKRAQEIKNGDVELIPLEQLQAELGL